MKILVIGDIHGLTCWQTIVEKHVSDVEKVVFLGDYFDTFDSTCTPAMQIENFLQIVALAKKHHTKIDLLLGNHDAQYMSGTQCSGFNIHTSLSAYPHLKDLYRDKWLKMVSEYDNYLFSHAGVSAVWMQNCGFDNIAAVGEWFQKDKSLLCFVDSPDDTQMADSSGNNDFQNPVWIRPNSLISAMYGEYNQVVGHTHLPKIRIEIDGKQKLILADTLPNEYLIVDTEKHAETIYAL
jgi:predicted phosphodiesterase